MRHSEQKGVQRKCNRHCWWLLEDDFGNIILLYICTYCDESHNNEKLCRKCLQKTCL